MHLLAPTCYVAAYSLYRQCAAFFPLIGAVLLNEQEGKVYVDDANAPSQVYVEHAFGFAQIFGSSVPDFETALKVYLFKNKGFPAAKIRLYTPNLPSFLLNPEYAALRSERQRFTLTSAHKSNVALEAVPHSLEGVRYGTVTSTNVALVEDQFGVVSRFWKTPKDFILKSSSVVAFVSEMPVAICYAAAIASQRAEIDVLTLPNFRHSGLGKQVVMRFIQNCREQGLSPLWDCFTNNAGSMALCRATGFGPASTPYPFYTINK